MELSIMDRPASRFVSAHRLNELPQHFYAHVATKVNHEFALGKDIINLGQGGPDLPTPAHIVAAMQEAVTVPQYHRYPPIRGFDFLRRAICQRYREDYGVELDPDHEVAILPGGKTGVVEISQCLLNPGDVCLVPDPGYSDYWSGIVLAGGRCVFMPLTADHHYYPEYNALNNSVLHDAKLMFINYPNNPTGVNASREFYQETVRFAEKYGIVVASDFAYGATGFDGQRPISFLEIPGAKDIGVEFYTLSKSYNMAGWRIGFALGNRDVIAMINRIQDHYYSSIFGAVQKATEVALCASQDCVHEFTATYERRRNALFRELERINWRAKPPEGSFFCWLPVAPGYSSESFSDKLLYEAQVMVAPGIGFGPHGEGYVRLGLLADEARIVEAVERVGRLALFE
jgi:aminotransferase